MLMSGHRAAQGLPWTGSSARLTAGQSRAVGSWRLASYAIAGAGTAGPGLQLGRVGGALEGEDYDLLVPSGPGQT